MKTVKNEAKNILLQLSSMIVFFLFSILIITSVFFAFKISINSFYTIFSALLTVLAAIIYNVKHKKSIYKVILIITSFLLCITISLIIAGNTFDSSWDGNSYHKTAIGELKNGWNPNYEGIGDFNSSDRNNYKVNGTHDIWNDHYAKGAWIIAANFYRLTNNIESGKAINILLLIAAFFAVLSFLLEKINAFMACLLSLIVVLNPVCLTQCLTFYNDNLIYSLIVLLNILLLDIADNNGNVNNSKYIMLTIIISLLINIKFTGLAYAGITALVYFIYLIIHNKSFKCVKKMVICGFISLFLGIVVIGYSSYVKNTLYFGHPFYPLFGENSVDIMTTNQPQSFSHMNRIDKFLTANFSKSDNITAMQERNPELKILFSFSKSEIENLSIPDLRIGGFGVLFGGILLVSTVVILVGLYFSYKDDKRTFKLLTLILVPIIILTLALEESWWARYLPQVYIIPIVALLLLYKYRFKKVNTVVMVVLSILMLYNSWIFVSKLMIVKSEEFRTIRNDLKTLSSSKDLYVYTSDFNGAVYNLYDLNKNIHIIGDSNQLSKDNKPYYKNMLYVAFEEKKESIKKPKKGK